jgi:hypothetical protein
MSLVVAIELVSMWSALAADRALNLMTFAEKHKALAPSEAKRTTS